MSQPTNDPNLVKRLANTIASDIAMYNEVKATQALKEDTFFEFLKAEIEEGRKHFNEKVDPEFHDKGYLERALVDVLLGHFAGVDSEVW
jgi:hypothetical protein